MTITLITFPKFKLTLGVTEYENVKMKSAKVIRNENGFDIATIQLDDTSLYPATVTDGTAVQLEVGEKGSAYPTNPMFKGDARFPVIELSTKPTLTLSCLGAGYGLGQMRVAYEYGTQSVNPALNTITTILTNATHGIIPRYVNRVFEAGAAGDSGFNYDVTDVDTINDVINYIEFPYKPANQSVNDLCDLVTALKAGGAGPHWIVTTDDHFRMKLLTSTQAGEWTKYYGDSQANATLTYGEHYEIANYEGTGAEANYIIYYGNWRRPSNGDAWTENTSALWGKAAGCNAVDYAAIKQVNTYSLQIYDTANPSGVISVYYPSAKTATWDFSGFTDFNVPHLNFYVYFDIQTGDDHIDIRLCKSVGNYYELTITPPDRKWQHYSLPVGPYFNVGLNQDDATKLWVATGAPNWNDINWIEFYMADAEKYDSINDRYFFLIDGLYFGDAAVCRVAYDSDISPYSMKLITDNVGKDDSLKGGAGFDTGLMAQLAYAELLRSRKECYLGWTKLKGIIPEALPGQWFYQQADMRATKIVHEIDKTGFYTTLYLTDDLTNGRARMRYEDVNKIFGDMRPEFQDRQASSIKAGNVDWRITRLAVDY